MIEVQKAIYQPIDNAHAHKTYRTQATQNAEYPYVVYKLLPVDPTESNRDDYTLEISCWDKPKNGLDTVVAEMADNIRRALVKFRRVDEHNLVMVSRPSVGYVPDDDEQVRRYDVTATLMTYRRL